jgi:hypothetical protein
MIADEPRLPEEMYTKLLSSDNVTSSYDTTHLDTNSSQPHEAVIKEFKPKPQKTSIHPHI